MAAANTGNPDPKLVAFSGGQTLGDTRTYFEAAGLEAGQVKAIGFDTHEFIIELRNVTKSFGNVNAVDGISFGVRPGEVAGLIGDNGAGGGSSW